MFRPSEIENAHHATMFDPREKPRFAQKTLSHAVVVDIGTDELQRDLHVEVEVMGDPDGSHPTASEHTDEPVLSGNCIRARVPRDWALARAFLVAASLTGQESQRGIVDAI